MIIGSGENKYEWIDNWAEVPDSESTRDGWAHHGMVVTADGRIFAFHPGEPTMLIFNSDGDLLDTWEAPVREAHQMALEVDGDNEYLWIADPGSKSMRSNGTYSPVIGDRGGQVIKMTLDGQLLLQITQPDHEIYVDGTFAPTSTSTLDNGDVWVSDGYGESYIHRFTATGEYLGSINGEEGDAGRFSCPHGVWIDRRKSEPELYVADRTNHRVQVYDTSGNYLRQFGSEVLTSPSNFAIDGDHIIVGELRARLAVFDIDDNFVCYIGENESIARVERNSAEDVPGWPNNLDADGNVIRSKILEPGKFNSPHGLAADSDGNLYSGEWLVGGRYTKLVKQ
jgi:DNA-binding beta-propeller fold protein YncE